MFSEYRPRPEQVETLSYSEIIDLTRRHLKSFSNEQIQFLRRPLISCALVASKLQPGTLIVSQLAEFAAISQLVAGYQLHHHKEEPTSSQPSKLLLASHKLDHLTEYVKQIKLHSTDTREYHQITGAFLGYPKRSIEKFIDCWPELNQKHPYWRAVADNLPINDNILLALHTTGVLPSNIEDEEVIIWGSNVRLLLDEIDPSLADQIVTVRRGLDHH